MRKRPPVLCSTVLLYNAQTPRDKLRAVSRGPSRVQYGRGATPPPAAPSTLRAGKSSRATVAHCLRTRCPPDKKRRPQQRLDSRRKNPSWCLLMYCNVHYTKPLAHLRAAGCTCERSHTQRMLSAQIPDRGSLVGRSGAKDADCRFVSRVTGGQTHAGIRCSENVKPFEFGALRFDQRTSPNVAARARARMVLLFAERRGHVQYARQKRVGVGRSGRAP